MHSPESSIVGTDQQPRGSEYWSWSIRSGWRLTHTITNRTSIHPQKIRTFWNGINPYPEPSLGCCASRVKLDWLLESLVCRLLHDHTLPSIEKLVFLLEVRAFRLVISICCFVK